MDGDTVLVSDGLYNENINFKGKAIMVASHYWLDNDERHIFKTQIRGSTPKKPSPKPVALFITGEDNHSILMGFTITQGSGMITSGGSKCCGGGIFCLNSAPQILHNRIINNILDFHNLSYGGGICCLWEIENSSEQVIIEDNIIEGNIAKGGIAAYGGGIYVAQTARISGNKIQKNQSISLRHHALGGGISCNGRNHSDYRFEITENNVIGNLSKTTSLQHTAMGGGIAVCEGTLDFSTNMVMDNHLSSVNMNRGAGLFIYRLAENSTISHNRFCRNSAITEKPYLANQCFGGGIHLQQIKKITIENNCIRQNEATLGGGLSLDFSSMTFRSNVVMNNKVDQDGGGIYLIRYYYPHYPAPAEGNSTEDSYSLLSDPPELIAWENSVSEEKPPFSLLPSKLYNNTFTENLAAARGGAIYSHNNNLEIVNTILWEDRAQEGGNEISVQLSSIYLNYCDIQSGWPLERPKGNISQDPKFLAGQSCCLSPESPCIDAGDPATIFNDPEDPNNPGMALLPAMGTIRNDMGAFGGPCACGLNPTEYSGEVMVSEETVEIVPENFLLLQNYPNPFNPSTMISWQLTVGSQVKLSVYDLLGKEVAVLVNEKQVAGFHQIEFDASGLASGVYLYQLRVVAPSPSLGQGFVETRKMVLMR